VGSRCHADFHKAEEGGELPEYVLEIVEGPEAGRRIELSGPLELGRDPSIGGSLPLDELVSRRHTRVTPVDDGARIEDLVVMHSDGRFENLTPAPYDLEIQPAG